MPEVTPPPDNLHPVDPNALSVPKAPPEGITPASLNIPGPDKPEQPTLETKQSLTQPEQQGTMDDQEWEILVMLGRLPYNRIVLDEQFSKTLQGLTDKGRRVYGERFKEELSARKAKDEAISEARDIANPTQPDKGQEGTGTGFYEMVMRFKADAQKLMDNFNQKMAEEDERFSKLEAELRKKIDMTEERTPEQILSEVLNDPKVVIAKAEINWIQLLGGRQSEEIGLKDIDPKLMEEIKVLKDGAMEMIMKDPKGYEEKLRTLKERFFKSQGIDPQNQPKTNII